MIVGTWPQVAAQPVTVEGAQQVTIRWLIGQDSAAPHFLLRLFEVAPGGHTPLHRHQMEHEVFVLAGRGRINAPSGAQEIGSGTFALIAPEEEHQFENIGSEPLRFLCIIPRD